MNGLCVFILLFIAEVLVKMPLPELVFEAADFLDEILLKWAGFGSFLQLLERIRLPKQLLIDKGFMEDVLVALVQGFRAYRPLCFAVLIDRGFACINSFMFMLMLLVTVWLTLYIPDMKTETTLLTINILSFFNQVAQKITRII